MKDKAKAYAALLLSTGMAYEITPDTIAYRAFIDGYEAGEASMAYLVRELGRNRAALQTVEWARAFLCLPNI